MLKIKKQNILINNAGAGFLISSTGVIYSTGAWGCSHQIYYSFSASKSLLRIHSLLITISSSSRRSLKSLQCEEANSYICLDINDPSFSEINLYFFIAEYAYPLLFRQEITLYLHRHMISLASFCQAV